MSKFSKCSECSNALFDPIWGEWKCKVTENFVYYPVFNCENYKEGTPDKSMISEDYYRELEGEERED